MINEKEVRIGNLYATIRNHEVVVKGIDTENKFVVINPVLPDLEITARAVNTVIFEDLNPIELTEPKLLQYGFVNEETTYLKIVSENGARFEWHKDLQQIVLRDCNEGIIGQSLRYVHQFQNAYYYLTGKELF